MVDGAKRERAHTLSPTCLPVPGSFVESFTTVVPRLYSAFASPIRSCSRSPWIPVGGSDCAERGESGAGGRTTSDGRGGMAVGVMVNWEQERCAK